MKKLRIAEQNFLTLEEGWNKYLDNCRSRNLREGTINHYLRRHNYVSCGRAGLLQAALDIMTHNACFGNQMKSIKKCIKR